VPHDVNLAPVPHDANLAPVPFYTRTRHQPSPHGPGRGPGFMSMDEHPSRDIDSCPAGRHGVSAHPVRLHLPWPSRAGLG
jgi:hypothetical protein